jgi:hypothetical protein
LDWRWNWIGSLLWNLVVHAVSFQWSSLGSDIDAIKGWFSSFWGAITGYADDIEDWARGRISWLSGYAFGLYVQALDWINSQIASVRGWVSGQFSNLWNTFWGKVSDLYSYAYSQYTAAVSWARSKVDWAIAYLKDWATWWINWLRDRYEWILSYRWLVTDFLHGAQTVINWLWHTAWGNLQAFLADPKGWVLGTLLGPLIDGINWWRKYGPMLANFAVNQLPNLLNLLGVGFGLLMRFVDRPGQTILELIADRFIDWLAGLIADNW